MTVWYFVCVVSGGECSSWDKWNYISKNYNCHLAIFHKQRYKEAVYSVQWDSRLGKMYLSIYLSIVTSLHIDGSIWSDFINTKTANIINHFLSYFFFLGGGVKIKNKVLSMKMYFRPTKDYAKKDLLTNLFPFFLRLMQRHSKTEASGGKAWMPQSPLYRIPHPDG